MAKQRFAPLLDPHTRLFRPINYKLVHFVDRLIKNPFGLENRLFIHADEQGAAELIEVEFDEMSFRVADFQGEFHKTYVAT